MLSDEARDLLWLLGALERMIEWGLIQGPAGLTASGHSFFEHHETTWKPADERIEPMLIVIGWPPEHLTPIKKLVMEFRDDRSRMEDFVNSRRNTDD